MTDKMTDKMNGARNSEMNRPILKLTSELTNGGNASEKNAWKRQSVQAFFATLNWDNHSPEMQASVAAAQSLSVPALSLQLKTRNFLSAINWEGEAIANFTSSHNQALDLVSNDVSDHASINVENRFTIENFFDLF